MKKHSGIQRLYTIMLFSSFFILFSCGGDKTFKMLAHKWRITTDEVSLDLQTDSTFIFSQRNQSITGVWKITDHNKSILFKEKGNSEKKLDIIILTDRKLKLSNNGEDQDYIRAD